MTKEEILMALSSNPKQYKSTSLDRDDLVITNLGVTGVSAHNLLVPGFKMTILRSSTEFFSKYCDYEKFREKHIAEVCTNGEAQGWKCTHMLIIDASTDDIGCGADVLAWVKDGYSAYFDDDNFRIGGDYDNYAEVDIDNPDYLIILERGEDYAVVVDHREEVGHHSTFVVTEIFRGRKVATYWGNFTPRKSRLSPNSWTKISYEVPAE